MGKHSRSRSSFGALLIIMTVTTALLVPTAIQAAPAGTYSASSSATLLNLQLFAVPGGPKLTVGQTSSELKSSPLSAKGTGTALICPGVTQCADATTQTASAPPDSDPAAVNAAPELPSPLNNIVQMTGLSGDAAAGTASGDPTGIGTGGLTRLSAVLDVGSLSTDAAGVLDEVTDQLATLIGLVPGSGVPEVDQKVAEIRTALEGVLGAIDGDREVLAVGLAASTAKSLSSGNSVTGLANTAALQVGILPICPLTKTDTAISEAAECTGALSTNPHYLDPLTHGLLIISVTIGEAKAVWDGKPTPTLTGTPANLTIKERDLSIVGAPSYKDVVNLDLPSVPTILLPDLLQTSVKVGSVEKTADTVTVNAVEIHALKGLVDSSTSSIRQQSATEGGILLQVGNLKASATGEGPTSVLGLPKTGGMRYVFYGVAALLVIGAPIAFLVSRRLRRAT